MQLLRKLAFPISFLYGLVVRLRNFLYDVGVFRSKAYLTPVIAVGNLSLGGTGKTPMVALLVALLKPSRKIAILSRGYGRSTRGFVMASPTSTARDIGDEPLQLYTNNPDIALAVDANRQRGIEKLEEMATPEIILMDDAFQHRKVRPELALLLTSYGKLYKDDYYLPTGSLRDSKAEADRADIIVVTKCPFNLPAKEQQEISARLSPRPHQLLLFATLAYDLQLYGPGKPMALETLKGQTVLLVTGIARPESLRQFLKEFGINFEHQEYRDHHEFSNSELQGFDSYPHVITTEKDYCRMQNPPSNCRFIRVRHQFLGSGEQLLTERLQKL